MKKIILLINAMVLAGIVYCQNIDTVFVRNLSLKKETWCVLATMFPKGDSLERETDFKIFNVMKEYKNSSNSTQIVFDSLPGRIARYLHNRLRHERQLIQDKIGNELFTKLAAYAPLAPFITQEDTNNTNEFETVRENGGVLWFRHKRN